LGIREDCKKRLKRRQGGKDSSRYIDAMEVDCEESCIGYSLFSLSPDSPVMRFLLSCNGPMTRVLFRKNTRSTFRTLIARIQSDLSSSLTLISTSVLNKTVRMSIYVNKQTNMNKTIFLRFLQLLKIIASDRLPSHLNVFLVTRRL